MLTSDLKLNFLTKMAEDRGGKSTGAVPKRVVAPGGVPSSSDTACLDPFVRPSSPSGNKGNVNVNVKHYSCCTNVLGIGWAIFEVP